MILSQVFQWGILAAGVSLLVALGASAIDRFRDTRVLEGAMLFACLVFVAALASARIISAELPLALRGGFGHAQDAIHYALACVTCVILSAFLWLTYPPRS